MNRDLEKEQIIWKLVSDTVEKGPCEIFGARDDILEPGDLDVEKSVINFIDDAIPQNVFEGFHVNQVTDSRVNGTKHGDLENIVMAVTMGIVALAVGFPIPLIGLLRVVQPVGGFEVDFDRH